MQEDMRSKQDPQRKLLVLNSTTNQEPQGLDIMGTKEVT